MATKTYSPVSIFLDNNGNVMPAGEIVTYESETTTPADTWLDADGAVANSNPIVLDGNGRAVIFLTPGEVYTFEVYNSDGLLQYTLDGIQGVPLAAPPTDINGIDQGRLTYEPGVPVPDSDLQNQATLYYTPYNGNTIALFDVDAGVWRLYVFSELSLDITGFAANEARDIFMAVDGTSLILESVAWADPLVLPIRGTQNGVLTKDGDPSRRLLGSILMSEVAGRGADTYSFRGISNLNNPVPRTLIHFGQGSWTYTLATLRQADGDTMNQVTAFACVAGRAVSLMLQVTSANTVAAVPRYVAIGQNSTTVVATGCLYTGVYGPIGDVSLQSASYQRTLTGGRVDLAWLEYSVAVGTTTWVGADTVTQNGLSGNVIA